MKVVILAGGLGERLMPFTAVIPKPLMPLNGKSIIERQLNLLIGYGASEIFVCTNYMADFVEQFIRAKESDIKIRISRESHPLGTAGPLTLIKDQLDEPFLVINGDILTLLNFREFFLYSCQKDPEMNLAIREQITPYDFGVIDFANERVIGIREKPEIRQYILSGIYYLSPRILNLIPEDTYFGMDSLIKLLLAENRTVMKYEFSDYWIDIGRYDDFEGANIAAQSFDGPHV